MKKTLWILFYSFVFFFLLYNSFSSLDPDFGWHLRFGQIIWQTQTVPHGQLFMWTLPDKMWVDHEWLSNLFMYVIWSLGGYLSLTVVFALVPLFTFLLINVYLLKNYLKTVSSQITLAVIEIAMLLVMRGHLGVRVQEITVLGITILLLTLIRSHSQRHVSPPWWLPVLFYLWACMHAGFLIGLVILAGWLIWEIIVHHLPQLLPKNFIPLTKPLLYQWMIIGGLCVAATLLTPYGLTLYHFLSDYRDTFYQHHIKEWLPPYAFPLRYGQLLGNALVISSTLVVYKTLKQRHLVFNYAVTGLFVLMAFKSVRHFPLLMVVWLILIAPYFLPEITRRLVIPYNRLIALTTATCLGLLVIYILLITAFTTTPFTSYCRDYPCVATTFLKQHPEYHDHLLNSYNFGGYLIGVAPEIPLFIDGRLPQYPFNGKSILEEYYQFLKPELVRKKLDEYEIRTVFYQKITKIPQPDWFEHYFLGYTPRQTIDQPLLAHLETSPSWQKVYEDDLSLIYIRR